MMPLFKRRTPEEKAAWAKIDTQKRIWDASKVIGLFVVMLGLAIIFLFPYIFMVNKSLMSSEMVIDKSTGFWPDWTDLRFVNYVELFSRKVGGNAGSEEGVTYLQAMGNTMIIEVFNLIAVPLSASMAAFAFAKIKWKGRNVVFALMMMTIMLPSAATQIPLYLMYSKIGWLNSLWPFMIPNLFGGGALYIFLIRQYMKGIPNELIDAAKIDGCGYFRIYAQIILPNCKTILIYIMINVFMAYWGDYYGPLIYMNGSDAPYTFAYALFASTIEGDAATQYGNIRMAGGVFMTIFPAILFMVFQNTLTDGAITSGLKG